MKTSRFLIAEAAAVLFLAAAGCSGDGSTSPVQPTDVASVTVQSIPVPHYDRDMQVVASVAAFDGTVRTGRFYLVRPT